MGFEPTRLEVSGFSYHYSFCYLLKISVCGLDFAFIRSGWRVSSLYTFLENIKAWLGVAIGKGFTEFTRIQSSPSDEAAHQFQIYQHMILNRKGLSYFYDVYYSYNIVVENVLSKQILFHNNHK